VTAKIYLDTSVISYLTTRGSRDLIIATHQLLPLINTSPKNGGYNNLGVLTFTFLN